MLASLARIALFAIIVINAAIGWPIAAQADTSVDAVALLPLDADKALEIYGQPVASEIARVLVAGNVDVVVVGPRMAVPPRARVIVDGTITGSSKGGLVVLTLRMRNPSDGTVLDTFSSTAASLATIDRAATDLAARILPAVRNRLVALRKPNDDGDRVTDVRPHALPAKATPLPFSVTATAGGRFEPLRGALGGAVERWAHAQGREPVPTDPKALNDVIGGPVRASDLGIAFEVVGFDVEAGAVPLARARVRVRIVVRGQRLPSYMNPEVVVKFDRVVVTDTVVGERGMATDALAARVAREVLEILRPHIRRVDPRSWR